MFVSGCAARRVTLPADSGTPLPDVDRVHGEVTSACAGVRTLTAELALAGRVGGERVRGRVIAGLARPLAMRLEGVAPFGPPAFILAAHDNEAVLFLPRDRRVVRESSAARLLDALVGLALEADDLRAILTGCVVSAPRPLRGSLHQGGWVSIALEGGATMYLRRQDSQWILRAARRDDWLLEYRRVARRAAPLGSTDVGHAGRHVRRSHRHRHAARHQRRSAHERLHGGRTE